MHPRSIERKNSSICLTLDSATIFLHLTAKPIRPRTRPLRVPSSLPTNLCHTKICLQNLGRPPLGTNKRHVRREAEFGDA